MIRCGKGCMPECEYFTTGGCVSPFNCPYKLEEVSVSTVNLDNIRAIGFNCEGESKAPIPSYDVDQRVLQLESERCMLSSHLKLCEEENKRLSAALDLACNLIILPVVGEDEEDLSDVVCAWNDARGKCNISFDAKDLKEFILERVAGNRKIEVPNED